MSEATNNNKPRITPAVCRFYVSLVFFIVGIVGITFGGFAIYDRYYAPPRYEVADIAYISNMERVFVNECCIAEYPNTPMVRKNLCRVDRVTCIMLLSNIVNMYDRDGEEYRNYMIRQNGNTYINYPAFKKYLEGHVEL